MEPDNMPTQPAVQPVIPQIKLNGKQKTMVKKFLPIVLAVLLLASIGIIVWQTVQTNDQNAKIKTLEAEVAKVKAEAATAANQNAMLHSYGQVAKSVADAYNTDFGHYPILTTDFKTKDGIIALPVGVTASIKDPVATLTTMTFKWEYTGPAAAPTGGRITYWDLGKNKISDNIIYVGTATSKSTFVTPTS